jgi:predicted alternative tryptophan synthase beta-subunit
LTRPVRISFRQKPGRCILIELFGGRVEESPSPNTEAGSRFYVEDPDHPGSLGMDFIPPPIHAGGLRYHGMAPLVSHLVKGGLVEPVAYGQDKVFTAARTFLMTEGILPAPESSHAIAAVIDEAVRAREADEEKVILFNLSGHGFLDINAFDQA